MIWMSNDAISCLCNAHLTVLLSSFPLSTKYDYVLYDQDGLTPLMYAAAGGHVAAIEVLLTRGANIEAVDNVSNCGCTAYCVND